LLLKKKNFKIVSIEQLKKLFFNKNSLN